LAYPFFSLSYLFNDLRLPFREFLQLFKSFIILLNTFGLPFKWKQSLFKRLNLPFIIRLPTVYQLFIFNRLMVKR